MHLMYLMHFTNTLDGLELAYAKGYRIVEVDLEHTKDGKLVCIHDWATQRFFHNIVDENYTPDLENYNTLRTDGSSHFHYHCDLDSLLQWTSKKDDMEVFFDIKDCGVFKQIIALPSDSWLKQATYYISTNYKIKPSAEGSGIYAFDYLYNQGLYVTKLLIQRLLDIDENKRAENQFAMIKQVADRIQQEAIPSVLHKIIPTSFACDYYKDGKTMFQHILDLGFKKVQCDIVEHFIVLMNFQQFIHG